MILFIDMDEVFADAYNAHIELYNKAFSENLKAEDCLGREVWQCVPKHHQDSIRKHAFTDGFFSNLRPIKDSQEVIKELTEKYEVYVASAAMEYPNSLREKSDWLDLHFPFIHWKNRILCGNKHILSGDILIDDRAYNLENFKGRKILFTSPHNVHTEGYERANNWREVAGLLL
ncbi:5'(3')-deoxyribonucleotidase [Arenibacter sp. 6A1]|uniref:5' nucleotidase, NT5C type n=1 Tax=Arenibacter sp. 6A1 TaxID=2720391 RepID=UPI001447C388|nr:5'(3')-deoxyribonucleotidase [Arenibacter sp. 6A1]NKI25983.1 5'(3')-deoxyribonucleotidase [Arenibacter sp. 6A1]